MAGSIFSDLRKDIKSVSSEFKAIKEMEIEEMQLNGDDVYWVNDIAYNERKLM